MIIVVVNNIDNSGYNIYNNIDNIEITDSI